jgi:hypothetical protein
LSRWIERGKRAPEGSRYREFAEAVALAEENPSLRALKAEQGRLRDPAAAWNWLVRSGEFDPEPHETPAVIVLRWPGGIDDEDQDS